MLPEQWESSSPDEWAETQRKVLGLFATGTSFVKQALAKALAVKLPEPKPPAPRPISTIETRAIPKPAAPPVEVQKTIGDATTKQYRDILQRFTTGKINVADAAKEVRTVQRPYVPDTEAQKKAEKDLLLRQETTEYQAGRGAVPNVPTGAMPWSPESQQGTQRLAQQLRIDHPDWPDAQIQRQAELTISPGVGSMVNAVPSAMTPIVSELPESVRETPILGPTAEFLRGFTSPAALTGAAVWPGATAWMVAGGAGLGALGYGAEELGAPKGTGAVSQIAGTVLGPVAGPLAGRAALAGAKALPGAVREAMPVARELAVAGEEGGWGMPGFLRKNVKARLTEMEVPPEPVGPRPPTIREVEARSKPTPPEVRAEIAGPAPAMRFELEPFEVVAQRWGDRFVENWWTKAQDLLGGKIGTVARTPEEVAVRRAFIQRDLYASTQGDSMRAGTLEWLGKNQKILGINGRGRATAVKIAEGAEIPKGLEQRLVHIVEHPEKYILTAEQETAIKEAADRYTMMLRRMQAEGIDIREWQGGFWHRIVTKRPTAEPGRIGGGTRLGARPPAARMRVFGDVEDAWNRGYRYANDVDAMMAYGQDAAAAVADRNTVRTVQNLGFKPSEKVDAAVIQELRDARAGYRAARAAASKTPVGTTERATALEAEVRLDNAMRAMRLESRRWAEKQPKVFGRIVSPEVADEFSRYVGDLPTGTIDQVFQLMRANMIWGDLSAAGVQTQSLIWRDPVTWLKATGYSVRAMASEPTSYILKNIDAIESGTRYGAIRAPDEFLLRTGKGIAHRFGELPGVKWTQRAFEWDIFVAQTERWKAVQRMATTEDDLLELASVVRSQTGTALLPGLTTAQAKVLGRTWFAGRFLVSTLATFKNAMRGGVAGNEARRTLAQIFGGVAATTAAINMVTTGKPGNFTDPDKPGFLGIRLGEGYVYLYGPFQPLFVAGARSARASVMLAQGQKPSNRDLQAWPRFVEGKLSLPYRVTAQGLEALGVPLEAIRGEPYESPQVEGVGGWVRQLGEYMPIGPSQAVQGIEQGFYAAALEPLGFKTSPLSPSAKLVELWEKYRSQLPTEYGPAPDYDKTTGGMRSWFYDQPDVAPVRERQIKEGEQRGKGWAESKAQVDKFTADWEPTFAQALADPQGRTNLELSDAMGEHLADRAKLSQTLYGDMGDNDPRTPMQKLADDYYTLELPSMATSEQREDFFAKQDAMITEHPELLQELHDVQVLKFQDPAVREFAEKRWQAKQVQKEYYNIPSWMGLTLEEGREVDRLLAEAKAQVSLGNSPDLRVALQSIPRERFSEKAWKTALSPLRERLRSGKRRAFKRDPENAEALKMFEPIGVETTSAE